MAEKALPLPVGEIDVDHFSRIFEVPIGAPWDQARAASLAAIHSSPLPESDVFVGVRRLGRWAPRQVGRYAAVYVRRADLVGQAAVAMELEGRKLSFVFGNVEAQRSQFRRGAFSVALLAVCATIALLGMFSALERRRLSEEALTKAEADAQRAVAAANRAHQLERNQRIITQLGLERSSTSDLLVDLAWLARFKTPAAKFNEVRWSGKALEAVTGGGETPFLNPDRTVALLASNSDSNVWQVSKPSAEHLGGFRAPSIVFSGRFLGRARQ